MFCGASVRPEGRVLSSVVVSVCTLFLVSPHDSYEKQNATLCIRVATVERDSDHRMVRPGDPARIESNALRFHHSAAVPLQRCTKR